MTGLLNVVIGLATLFYPVAVYFGIQYLQPWQLASVLLGFLLCKLNRRIARQAWGKPLTIAGVAYCGFVIWSNTAISLRFYPVVVNAVLLAIFAWSLQAPPSIIERLARLQVPDLPASGVRYTRRVTIIWCGFFMFNGLMALYTAVWASFAVWSLYNGLIAYLLMGVLMAAEYLVRMKTQRYAR